MKHLIYGIFLLITLSVFSADAQTNEITYQGNLRDGASPANGSYDFIFTLCITADVDGAGPTRSLFNVPVVNGVFTVTLDFLSGNFEGGPDRWLDIKVRPAGSGSYTTLAPRKKITSSPYALQSLNSTQLGGLAAGQFLQNTTTQQPSFNFNISGNGTAGGTLAGNIVNATSRYDLANERLIGVSGRSDEPKSNTFVGIGAGSSNVINPFGSSGTSNSFFGNQSGAANTTGSFNVFVGTGSGISNVDGRSNTFVGSATGRDNVSGSFNTFVGGTAGLNNTGSENSYYGAFTGEYTTGGTQNSYFGSEAGRGVIFVDSTGSNNSFFGSGSGKVNRVGNNNSFFGTAAGLSNDDGNDNSFFGRSAGRLNTSGNSNSFFGFEAGRANTASSNSFLGFQAGLLNTTGQNNTFVGRSAGQANVSSNSNAFFGTSAGNASTGAENTFIGFGAGVNNVGGNRNTFVGKTSGISNTTGNDNTAVGNDTTFSAGGLSFATIIGAGSTASQSNSIFLGRAGGEDTVRIPGAVEVRSTSDAELGGGGTMVAGLTTSFNIAIDNNEIMARNNGATSTLALNADGGNVNLIQNGTGNVGIGTNSPSDKLHVDGIIRVATLGAAGSTSLCRNASSQISTCTTGNFSEQSSAVKELQVQIEKLAEQNRKQQSIIESLVKSVCKHNANDALCKELK